MPSHPDSGQLKTDQASGMIQGPGGMAEWLKAAVLKTAFRYLRNGGSNPSPSALIYFIINGIQEGTRF